MSEVLVVFDQPIEGPGGQNFFARVCARPVDNIWEGWIEFQATDGETAVATPRETEQATRKELEYWAQGLAETYLQGALDRALRSGRLAPVSAKATDTPLFEEPAQPVAYAPPVASEQMLDHAKRRKERLDE